MRRVIFCRTEPDVLRCEVTASANPVVTRMNACACRLEQRIAATNQLRHSGPDIGGSRVAHPDTSVHCCRASLLVGNAFRRLRTRWRARFSVAILRRGTPVERHVTLTLHGRNAKKIFDGKISRKSIIVRILSCNGCQSTSIFLENTSLSYAVNTSIDRIMSRRNSTSDSITGFVAGTLSESASSRKQVTPLRFSATGGAS